MTTTTTCEHKSIGSIDSVVYCHNCEVVRLDTAEVAKMIRAELKAAFPGTKFSVTMKRYSMGSSVSVRYQDGPPVKAVSAITDKYSGKSFDGMDDSTHYHRQLVGGRVFQTGIYEPSIHRTLTADADHKLHSRVEDMIRERFINPDPDMLYRAAWVVIGSLDARWETVERAVERWFATGMKTYDR